MNAIPRQSNEMPSNEPAEQGLLGALLVDNSAFERVCDFLRPEHFYVPANGRIYEAISSLRAKGQSVTPVILQKSFATDGDLSEVGGAEYIIDLVTHCVTVLNAADHGKHILDLFQRRQEIALLQQGIDDAKRIDPDKSALDIAAEVEAGLYEISEGNAEGRPVIAFSSAIADAIKSAGAAYRKDPGSVGLSTGLIDVDKIIGGLRSPDLVIIAGRPSMGKTALATGMAWHAASHGARVAFFSLEMSAEQLASRILSSASGVPGSRQLKGDVNEREFRAFMDAGQRLAGLPLLIDDRAGLTMAQIRNTARRIKRTGGLDLIVVDYLQLVSGSQKVRSEGRTQEVTEITKGLKALAKDFEVPVIALSQLSRATEKRDERTPQLSDLRDSGSIEQDADIVAFVYREQYYVERDEPTPKKDESQDSFETRHVQWGQRLAACANKAQLIVAKNRHGAYGSAEMHFHGETTTFSSAAAFYSVAGSR